MYNTTDVTRMLLVLGALLLPLAAAGAGSSSMDYEPYQVRPFYPPPRGGDYPQGHVLNDTISWHSSFAPFVAGKTYTPAQQAKILDDDVRFEQDRGEIAAAIPSHLVPEEFREGSPPGQNVLMVHQGPIPEASQPAPSALGGLSPDSLRELFEGGDSGFSGSRYNPPHSWRTYRTQSFGNNLFGSRFHVEVNLSARQEGPSAVLQAIVESHLTARVFNLAPQVTRSRVTVTSRSGTTTANVRVYAMGIAVLSEEQTIQHERTFTVQERERHFFTRAKVFMVGPVPITVAARITGRVETTVTVTPSIQGFSLNVQPGSSAHVSATGGVSVVVLGFGVGGRLALIDAAFPTQLEMRLVNQQATWRVNTTMTVNTLAGSISLWSRVRFIFYNRRWDLTIAQWRGLTLNENIFTNFSDSWPMPGAVSGPTSLSGYIQGL